MRRYPLVVPALLLAVLLPGCGRSAPPEGRDGAAAPILRGPYLGETPPGETPVPFAPGVVSTGLGERDVAMMPDGTEIYWGVFGGSYAWSTILMSRVARGTWTRPEVAPCCRDLRYLDLEPHITPDGQRFMWLSSRPGGAGGQDIWVMDRVGDGWGEPHPLPAPVNTPDSEYFPSTTRDGTIYFTRSPAGGGENLIYRSRNVDGVYQEPEVLPAQVNAGLARYNAFVDPDERYLVLGMVGGPGSFGGTDHYVVFRSADDRWSPPVNLGEAVNTESTYEYSAYVSPDGRYLFFMTARPDLARLAPGGVASASSIRALADQPNNGASDIYWMSAGLLERLRPTADTARPPSP